MTSWRLSSNQDFACSSTERATNTQSTEVIGRCFNTAETARDDDGAPKSTGPAQRRAYGTTPPQVANGVASTDSASGATTSEPAPNYQVRCRRRLWRKMSTWRGILMPCNDPLLAMDHMAPPRYDVHLLGTPEIVWQGTHPCTGDTGDCGAPRHSAGAWCRRTATTPSACTSDLGLARLSGAALLLDRRLHTLQIA